MGNFLWGPLYFILDVAPENQISGWILLLICAMAILSYPLRPRTWSAILALLGVLAWLFFGLIGAGIDC